MAGILDAAASTLARQPDATMGDLAIAAGVGRATLYRYFPNREAVLTELARVAAEDLLEQVADAEVETAPVLESISRLTRGLVGVGSRYLMLGHAGKKPEGVDDLQQGLAEPIQRLFARGVRDGSLRDDVPPEILLRIYSGLLEVAIFLSGEPGLGPERASAAILKVFLDGAGPGAR